jgi:hypothetical protein
LKRLALHGLRQESETMMPLVRQVMRQTRERIFRGNTRAEDKLFSVFEPSTEIIRKGKAGNPSEFGKMVKLQEAENQIVIDYEVYDRRPSDTDLLIPAIEIHQAKLVARHVWSRQTPGSTPPGMKPRRRPAASNASASPIAPPRASPASASRRSGGSATARNGGPDARDASAWPNGGTGSIAATTKAALG